MQQQQQQLQFQCCDWGRHCISCIQIEKRCNFPKFQTIESAVDFTSLSLNLNDQNLDLSTIHFTFEVVNVSKTRFGMDMHIHMALLSSTSKTETGIWLERMNMCLSFKNKWSGSYLSRQMMQLSLCNKHKYMHIIMSWHFEISTRFDRHHSAKLIGEWWNSCSHSFIIHNRKSSPGADFFFCFILSSKNAFAKVDVYSSSSFSDLLTSVFASPIDVHDASSALHLNQNEVLKLNV